MIVTLQVQIPNYYEDPFVLHSRELGLKKVCKNIYFSYKNNSYCILLRTIDEGMGACSPKILYKLCVFEYNLVIFIQM